MQKFINATNHVHVAEGDTLRGYDHEPMPGRPDAYVEGVVVELDGACMVFRVRVELDATFKNPNHNRVGMIVEVPYVSGEHCDRHWDFEGRVRVWR